MPDVVRVGEPARFVYTITDLRTGRPITDIVPSHQADIHLLAIRAADLQGFQHVHPRPTGRPGEFAIDLTFDEPGTYVLNSEFKRQGELYAIKFREEVTVVGGTPNLVPLVADRSPKVVGNVRVTLRGEARVDEESTFMFEFRDARTNQPITDLQPYLAAAGHVIVASEGGRKIEHEHGEVHDANGNPIFARPGTRFGPEIEFHGHFESEGLYKIWGQFKLGDGTVITVPFVVKATGNYRTGVS
jgi:Cu+-exporting ATPase